MMRYLGLMARDPDALAGKDQRLGNKGPSGREFRDAIRNRGRFIRKKTSFLRKLLRTILVLTIVMILSVVMFFTLLLMRQADQSSSCGTIGGGQYVPLPKGEPGPNLTIVAIALGVAAEMNASQVATLALMEAGLAESHFKNYANDGVHGPEDDKGTPSTAGQLAEAKTSLGFPHDAVGTDHASVGFLQQQVGPKGSGFGWGTVTEIMDPAHATRVFLERAKTKEGIAASRNDAITAAHLLAQDIQRSAFSDGRNYRKHEEKAKELMATIQADGSIAMGGSCSGVFVPGQKITRQNYGYQVHISNPAAPMEPQTPNLGEDRPANYTFIMPADGPLFQMVSAAVNMVDQHRPYIWAGGSEKGPGQGNQYCSSEGGMVGESFTGSGVGCSGMPGFDCSGLMDYVIGASGVKGFPNNCADCQLDWMRSHGAKDVTHEPKVPGDIIYWDYDGCCKEDHTAIYIGPSIVMKDGKETKGPDLMIAAPGRGDFVKIQKVYTSGTMTWMRYYHSGRTS